MAGSKTAGQKMRETMIERFGTEEKWREWMRENAAKGGRNGNTGGFAVNKELARTAGSKGGKAPRNVKKEQ